jgi:CheY-like chemotaxis protein
MFPPVAVVASPPAPCERHVARDALPDEGGAVHRTGPAVSSRALVIEDYPDLAWAMSEALTLLGFDVELAHDGASGLRLAAGRRPDVAFVDLYLPDLHGRVVARHLRIMHPAVILVAMSGECRAEERARCEAAGFDRYLAKPASYSDLQRALALTHARSSA